MAMVVKRFDVFLVLILTTIIHLGLTTLERFRTAIAPFTKLKIF